MPPGSLSLTGIITVLYLSENKNSSPINSLFVLLGSIKTLYTVYLIISNMAHEISSHRKKKSKLHKTIEKKKTHKITYAKRKKSPRRCYGELLFPLG